jgi:hypothetical protein
MNLKVKFYSIIAVGLFGLSLIVTGKFLDNTPLSIFGAVTIMVAATLRAIFYRCSKCKGYIGKFPGRLCKHCGTDLRLQ